MIEFCKNFSPDEKRGITKYLANIQGTHCPFVLPCAKNGVMVFLKSQVTLDCLHAEDDFASLAISAARKILTQTAGASEPTLVCYNVCFSREDIPRRAVIGTIQSVHWVIKCLYSSRGLAVGKFWKEQQITPARGGSAILPAPPMDFISIRTMVSGIEPGVFLENYRYLLTDVARQHAEQIERAEVDSKIDAGEAINLKRLISQINAKFPVPASPPRWLN